MGPNCEFAECPALSQENIVYTGNPEYENWSEEQKGNHCMSLGGIYNACGSACPPGDFDLYCVQMCIEQCELWQNSADKDVYTTKEECEASTGRICASVQSGWTPTKEPTQQM